MVWLCWVILLGLCGGMFYDVVGGDCVWVVVRIGWRF